MNGARWGVKVAVIGLPASRRELHLDLCLVGVADRCVRRDALGGLTEGGGLGGGAAGAGHSRLAVDDDVRIDHPGLTRGASARMAAVA